MCNTRTAIRLLNLQHITNAAATRRTVAYIVEVSGTVTNESVQHAQVIYWTEAFWNAHKCLTMPYAREIT